MDKVVFISHCTTTLGKGMNLIIPSPVVEPEIFNLSLATGGGVHKV